MQELEKILGEIKEALEENKVIELNGDGTVNRYIIDVASAWGSIKAIIHNHMNNGWIPVEERLPEDDRYIFLSFENFSLPMIGRYEQDSDGSGNFYIGDETESCINQDMYVTAWQPLPEPYRPERSVH